MKVEPLIVEALEEARSVLRAVETELLDSEKPVFAKIDAALTLALGEQS